MKAPRYYFPGEVARMFGVSLRTIRTWTEQGRLPCIRTLGGHRRYPAQEIDRILIGRREPLTIREGPPLVSVNEARTWVGLPPLAG